MQWLHKHMSHLFPNTKCEVVAWEQDYGRVQWLHKHMSHLFPNTKCEVVAWEQGYGRVQWLHKHMSHLFPNTKCEVVAWEQGYGRVQWLHKHMSHLFPNTKCEVVAWEQDYGRVQWLHKHMSHLFPNTRVRWWLGNKTMGGCSGCHLFIVFTFLLCVCSPLKFFGRVFFRSLLIFFCALSGGLAMWPIVPYFLCDGIFYLVLWNTVYAHILFVPWRFIRTRMRRRRFLQQQNIIMP